MYPTASRHNGVARPPVVPAADFVVGEWLVEPDLNRVSRNGRAAHVRPQLMDLLVYLARNTGRTVPRDELLSSVWPGQPYISGTGLPRCIAELRQSLGDRARGSTVIQTIPKRGYRLIAVVGPAPDVTPPVKVAAACPPHTPPAPRSGEPAPAPPALAHGPWLAPISSAHMGTSTGNPGQARWDRSVMVSAAERDGAGGLEASGDPRPGRQSLACVLRVRQFVARAWWPFRSRAR